MLTIINKPAILYIVKLNNLSISSTMSKVVITYSIKEAAELLHFQAQQRFDDDTVEILIEDSPPVQTQPSYDNIPSFVLLQISRGNLVEAIKLVRNKYNINGNYGLKEAKEYVDKIRDMYFSAYVQTMNERGW